MAKVGTSNPDRTISLRRLQCVVENNKRYRETNYSAEGSETGNLLPVDLLLCILHMKTLLV